MGKRLENGKQAKAAKEHGVTARTIQNWMKRTPPFPIDGTADEQRGWRNQYAPKSSGVKAVNETARLRRAQADMIELQAAERAGALMLVEDFDEALMFVLQTTAQELNGFGARHAHLLAGMTDPGEIRRYVDDELGKVRERIAARLADHAVARAREAGGSDKAEAAAGAGPVG